MKNFFATMFKIKFSPNALQIHIYGKSRNYISTVLQCDKLPTPICTLLKIPLMHLHHLARTAITHTVPRVQYPRSVAAHRQVATIHNATSS